MVKTRMVFKGNGHKRAIQFSNSLVVGGAANSEGEVQTVSDTMPIHKCLEMTLLAFK